MLKYLTHRSYSINASSPTSLKSYGYYGALEYTNHYISEGPTRKTESTQSIWADETDCRKNWLSDGKDWETTKGQWGNPEICNRKKTRPEGGSVTGAQIFRQFYR